MHHNFGIFSLLTFLDKKDIHYRTLWIRHGSYLPSEEIFMETKTGDQPGLSSLRKNGNFVESVWLCTWHVLSKYLGSDKNENNMDCKVYKATGVGVQEANLTILHSVGSLSDGSDLYLLVQCLIHLLCREACNNKISLYSYCFEIKMRGS